MKKNKILCGIHWEDEDGWWVSDEKCDFIMGLGKKLTDEEILLLQQTFDDARRWYRYGKG